MMIPLYKKFVLISLIALVFSFGLVFSGYAQQTNQKHIVKQGETLFSISRTYGVTVGELKEWNNLESNSLRLGQVLVIVPQSNDESILHEVKPGDSLFGISRQYNVTIAEIQEWNNFEGTSLEAGTELVIYPQSAEAEQPSIDDLEQMDQAERTSIVERYSESAAESENYTVKSGDTLYGIARQHDMTVNELRQINNLQDDMLRVGQRITVRKIQTAPSIAEGAEDSTPQGKFSTYRVQRNENSSRVLDKFNMTRSEFEALNPGMNADNISSGQQITVLLPPTRNFNNPYRPDANLENLGTVPVMSYGENDRANPTTSGELYNPQQLTAAHSNMALGNIIFIENPSNGRGVFVRVNDRHSGDGLKLSQKAFQMLGFSSIEQPEVTIYLDN
ncbi:LysM peptidoglycan-binding domain-containing protein [Rhodohalobacter sp. 614A]|uniref:LysM peptidoglycan-binding domain-containing protein n=1 Tax=Rhodohalobacter sp. 614A TaxID=2908649 RepID=UPI001F44300E|nr:LysM peptidoglycan-binding domain-containing protein [Rhodohalobacter sp. 614A]